jgi:hypothetical protein
MSIGLGWEHKEYAKLKKYELMSHVQRNREAVYSEGSLPSFRLWSRGHGPQPLRSASEELAPKTSLFQLHICTKRVDQRDKCTLS